MNRDPNDGTRKCSRSYSWYDERSQICTTSNSRLREGKIKTISEWGIGQMVMLRTHMDLTKPYIINVRNKFIT